MLTINETCFHQTVAGNPRFLIWFYTEWCGFCAAMRKEVEAFTQLPVFACDAELCGLLTAKFAVASVPCLVLIENGKPVRKAVGDMRKSEIANYFVG